jgi:hypothetical protein
MGRKVGLLSLRLTSLTREASQGGSRCWLGDLGTRFDASQAMNKAMPPRSQAVVVIDVGGELHTDGPTGGPRTLLDVPTSHCSRRFVM